MQPKRRFGRHGVVAVLLHGDLRHDEKLIERLEQAATQFGISEEYAFDPFFLRHPQCTTYGRAELIEQAELICSRGYLAVLCVGQDATDQMIAMKYFYDDPPIMVVGVDTENATNSQGLEQFEMVDFSAHFKSNASRLVRMCSDKHVGYEEALALMRQEDEERKNRLWGVFDDGFVILKGKAGEQHMVRFEDEKEAEVRQKSKEEAFVGKERTVHFKA